MKFLVINGVEMDVFRDAELELNGFLAENLKQYSRFRNFDFGPDKRHNVSLLSKYISHRVIDEYDVIRATLVPAHMKGLKNLFKKYSGASTGRVG